MASRRWDSYWGSCLPEETSFHVFRWMGSRIQLLQDHDFCPQLQNVGYRGRRVKKRKWWVRKWVNGKSRREKKENAVFLWLKWKEEKAEEISTKRETKTQQANWRKVKLFSTENKEEKIIKRRSDQERRESMKSPKEEINRKAGHWVIMWG